MLQSSLYFLTILAICAAALADCLRLGRGRGSGRLVRRLGLRLRLIRPWLAGWLLFQALFAAALLLSGNGERAAASLLLYGSATLLLPFLLYAGAGWTLAAGIPLFPATAAWRRRRGRAWRGRREGDPALRRRPRISLSRIGPFALLALLPILATVLLFLAVPWRPAAEIQTSLEPEQHGAFSNVLLLVYLLVSAAVVEEVLFRHYLLTRLATPSRPDRAPHRGRVVPAVLVAAALWALGHGGMVEPAWLKYAQIGFYGVALGVAQVRYGLEAAILLHLLFNAAALVLGALLAPGG